MEPYGSKLPPPFKENEVLTAAAFNAVKDYWVVDELPEDAPDTPEEEKIQDGDVVFVIGDSPVNNPDELSGVGGWAKIDEIETPTNDIDPYESDGITWKAWVWENPRVLTSDPSGVSASRDLMGSITLDEDGGLVEVLIVSGGGAGYGSSGGGGGGGVIATVVELKSGKNEIYVGSGSANADPGAGSSVGPVGIVGGSYRTPGDSGGGFSGINNTSPGAGAAGDTYLDEGSYKPGPGFSLDWVDGSTVVEYGAGGIQENIFNQQPPNPGTGGYYWPGGTSYNPGANGFVLIRVPQKYALNAPVRAMSDETRERAQANLEAQRQKAAIEGDE